MNRPVRIVLTTLGVLLVLAALYIAASIAARI